jgi:galactose mutarotase-like enzyme
MSHITVRPFDNALQSVVLSNASLELTVLPEVGAHIHSIVHKPSQTEFLWHHPRNKPHLHQVNEKFDDVFSGGWDELFPTCDACTVQGTSFPDHGELWSTPWDWAIEPFSKDTTCLFTGVTAKTVPVRFERRLVLDAQQPQCHVYYRVQNLSPDTLKLIWGIHPLFQISKHHRMDLPPGKIKVDLTSTDLLGTVGQGYDWPLLPTPTRLVDMRHLPGPEVSAFAGHYCTEPSKNWFALTDTKKQVGIALVYPRDIFRSLWLWQSYGGWRGLYHLAIEPWVGYPVKLDEAIQAGHHLTLSGEQTLEYKVSVLAYTGLIKVGNVTEHGVVE